MASTRTPADVASHIDNLDREGYTIAVGAFDAGLANELRDDIQRLERKLSIDTGQNGFEGHATTRVYNVWHGGGANITDAARVGIAMNYCAGWVRQQENQQLGIPLDTVRGFSPELQELCGFGVFHGLIGHIDKQSPAQRLLDRDRAHQMLWQHT